MQIYSRKGNALVKRKQYLAAKEQFTRCLDMIGKSEMNSKARDNYRLRTKKHMSIFNVTKSLTNMEIPKRPTFDLEKGPSDFDANVSSLLNMDGGKGGPVAKEDVFPCSTMLKERPLAAVVLHEELEVAEGLSDDRVQRLGEERSGVANGQDDGQRRRGGHAVRS